MLTFIKRTATSWQHDNGTVKSSFGGGIPITNDTENTIVFQLPNGTNFPIKSVLITDCKIIDKTDSDAEYTFATTTEFLDKLEELSYPFINTGGGGGGAGTNLGYTPSASNGTVTSSTGTDATIPLANGTDAGLSENNVTDGEKDFLITAGGKDLADYAKNDAVITAIGEALTTAETYTDNALEDYYTQIETDALIIGFPKIISKSTVSTSAHTGVTTEAILSTITINPNDFSVGDFLKVVVSFTKLGTAGTCRVRFRAGTSNSISDAEIATYTAVASSVDFGLFRDKMYFFDDAGTAKLRGMLATNNSISDITHVAFSKTNTAINPTSTWYFHITAQLTSGADSITLDAHEIIRV